MPLRSRSLIEGPSVFFLTTTTYNRRRFPEYPRSLRVIEIIMFQTIREMKISLFVYVIMPTHIHMIAGCHGGGRGISKFVHSLKGRVRVNIKPKGPLWQSRFDDLLLRTEKQFEIKLNYVHYNPVKDRLVERPEDWPYSSYVDWCERDRSRGILFDFESFFS